VTARTLTAYADGATIKITRRQASQGSWEVHVEKAGRTWMVVCDTLQAAKDEMAEQLRLWGRETA
jgi:hypothetical protein